MFPLLSQQRTLTSNHRKRGATRTRRRMESPLLPSDTACLYSTCFTSHIHPISRGLSASQRTIPFRNHSKRFKPHSCTPHGRPRTGRTNCVVGHQSTHVQGIIGLSSVNTLRGPTNELQIGRVAGKLVPSRFGMWFVSYSVIHVTILFGIAGAGELGEMRILDERPRSQEVLRLGGRLVQAFRRNV